MFHVILFCVCVRHSHGVDPDEVKSVMEGDSVTLDSGVTRMHTDDLILWKFGAKNRHLAKINRSQMKIFQDEGTFRDRLKMNNETGSLTITNITADHSGLYQVEIIVGNKVLNKSFKVSVCDHLPVPVLSRQFSQSSSSSDKCVVLCSVCNVSDVSLSWYKGKSLRSSISVSGVKTTVDLHLEVEYLDNNTYSCVVSNPITNQTQHLNMNEHCHRSPDRLAAPVISRVSTQRSSSSPSDKCFVLCSVCNVSDVSLSWYKGMSLLSSISVSGVKTTVDLHVEVEYHDNNTYSCVVSNPTTKQTQHLNISVICHIISDYVHHFSVPEAMTRLVLAALVGLAAVALVVYDIRSTRV